MLRSIYDMRGYTIRARDGAIGQIDHFLFDDRTGNVRYLVVRIGSWLLGQRVLLAPQVLSAVSEPFQMLDVALTRQQIKDSPDLLTNPPISRQQGVAGLRDDGYPLGWDMLPGPWFRNMSWYAVSATVGDVERRDESDTHRNDPHLRSTREVIGYRLQASDGAIGQVVDFIVDDTAWAVRSVVVDTGVWLPGKRVLLPLQRIKDIHWSDSTVEVGLLRATVKRHPAYDQTRLWPQNHIRNGQTRP
jgi:hypothetical protein